MMPMEKKKGWLRSPLKESDALSVLTILTHGKLIIS